MNCFEHNIITPYTEKYRDKHVQLILKTNVEQRTPFVGIQ